MTRFIILLGLICQFSWGQTNALEFPNDFMFGLANAPGHVEDNLQDIWIDYANSGGIYAFSNQSEPQKRLEFWTNYKVEIDLAHKAGIQIFRLGIDWGRLTGSSFNKNCIRKKNCQQILDLEAIQKYQEIIEYIRSKNLKVMLTLFHHSLPLWAKDIGGFTKNYVRVKFVEFAVLVFPYFEKQVDYWLTLNEPAVYAMLTHTVGLWPSKYKKGEGALSFLNIGPIEGRAVKVQDQMIKAHREIYEKYHQLKSDIKISIAQNIAYYTGDTKISKFLAKIGYKNFNYYFLDKIIDRLDFIGVNYYGAEWVKGAGIQIKDGIEYSEAGRAISTHGFYQIIKDLNERYKKYDLPFFVTENGIADETDILRPSYLIEHLAAIKKNMDEGVKILGYIFWTITDNLEWADGYCPKFGLVAVDRENNLERIPRPSYYLFQSIASSKSVTQEQRLAAWNLVESNQGRERPFCRAQDGKTPLHNPEPRTIVKSDWRFSL